MSPVQCSVSGSTLTILLIGAVSLRPGSDLVLKPGQVSEGT